MENNIIHAVPDPDDPMAKILSLIAAQPKL
jgi:hypothetical protein